MDWKNPKSIEAKISRLKRELTKINDFLYGFDRETDRANYAASLERKRDDIVRSSVLQLHTAIEDLLNLYMIGIVLDARPQRRSRKLSSIRGKALHKMLYGRGSMGFEMKLNFAVALGLLSEQAR